ncbi:MAG: 50S ribosomal protein L15 [Candidatus Dadabacteria bacterium]|nr:50S ribosomal protein L15 [Candidatus Dadabacteria bacterium]NIQ15152.1 50S ribosomal protein L15 [Candidatus Dadabacteria bacterium]
MLNTLSPASGSKKNRKRIGRGAGSQGKTSGSGHKGQRSRSGRSVSRWFEGGQTPLKRRIPKRGFKNLFKKYYEIINLRDLSRFDSGDITLEALKESGLITGKNLVKLLGNGEINTKINIQVNSSSKSAINKIEKAGGKVEII